MARSSLVAAVRRERGGDLVCYTRDRGAGSGPVVRENAEDQALAVSGGDVTRERSRRRDRAGLGVYVPFGRRSLHAILQSSVDSCYGHRVVKDGEGRVLLNSIEHPDQRLRGDEVMPRETAPVANHETVWLHSPRKQLLAHDLAGAVCGAHPAALQSNGLQQDLGDLVLRWLHQRRDDISHRQRDEGEKG